MIGSLVASIAGKIGESDIHHGIYNKKETSNITYSKISHTTPQKYP